MEREGGRVCRHMLVVSGFDVVMKKEWGDSHL